MDQVFYTGVVEDRNDPMMLGRCKVRVVGVHSEDPKLLPVADLPWAHPVTPITSAAMNGIGVAPVGPVEGTMVLVMFADGEEFQHPVMLGTIPGIPIVRGSSASRLKSARRAEEKTIKGDPTVGAPEASIDDSVGFRDPSGKYPLKDYLEEPDTNRLARAQKTDHTILKTKKDGRKTGVKIANSGSSWDQPEVPYAAKYPHNKVFQSESGHTIEIDDTPGAERIHVYSSSGSFVEMDATGNMVTKVKGNGYTIIDRNGVILVEGTCAITVNGDAAIKTGGDCSLEVGGDFGLKAGKVDIDCSDFNLSCSKFGVLSSATVDIKANGVLAVAGSVAHVGATVQLNSPLANPPGASVKFSGSID